MCHFNAFSKTGLLCANIVHLLCLCQPPCQLLPFLRCTNTYMQINTIWLLKDWKIESLFVETNGERFFLLHNISMHWLLMHKWHFNWGLKTLSHLLCYKCVIDSSELIWKANQMVYVFTAAELDLFINLIVTVLSTMGPAETTPQE